MKNPGIFATACAAVNCDFRSNLKKNVMFYSFPVDDFRCKLWVLNCRRLDLFSLGAYTLHSSYKLCGLHFEEKMFKKSSYILKLSAIPTIFNFPLVSFVTPVSPSCDSECKTKLPLGVVFEELTRVKVMSDEKLYITGGPLLRPGALEINEGKVRLRVTSDKSCVSEDMFYFVPILIAIVEDGKIRKIEQFHVLTYYLNTLKDPGFVTEKKDFEITQRVSIEDFLKGISITLDVSLLDKSGKESKSNSLCWQETLENSTDDKLKMNPSVETLHEKNEIKSARKKVGGGEIKLKQINFPRRSVHKFNIKETNYRQRPNILRSKRKKPNSAAVTSQLPLVLPSKNLTVSEEMMECNVENKDKIMQHPVCINNISDRLERIEKILKKNDQVLDGGYLFAEPSSPESNDESPTNELVNDSPMDVFNSCSDNENSNNNEVSVNDICTKPTSARVDNFKKIINFEEILPKDAPPSDINSLMNLPPVKFVNHQDSEAFFNEAKDKIPHEFNLEQKKGISKSGFPIIVNSSHLPLPDDLKKNLAKYLLINKDKDSVDALYSGRKVRATRTFIKIPISGNSNLTKEKPKKSDSDNILKNPFFVDFPKLSESNSRREGGSKGDKNVSRKESYARDNSCEIGENLFHQGVVDADSDPMISVSNLSTEEDVHCDLNLNLSPEIKIPENLFHRSQSIVNLKDLILSNFPEGTELIALHENKDRGNIISMQKDISSISVEQGETDSLLNTDRSNNCVNENKNACGNSIVLVQNCNLSNESKSTGIPDKSGTLENSVLTVGSPFVSNIVLLPQLIDLVNKITEKQNPSKVILLNGNANDPSKPNAVVPLKCYCQGVPPANSHGNRKNLSSEYVKLRDKYKSSVRKLKRLEKKVVDLKAKVKDPPKIKFTRVLEELKSNVSRDAYTLILAELKANSLGTKSRGFRFTEDMKELGARLLMAGPRIYKAFASVFTMPSKHTIKKWTNDRENRAIEALFAGREYEPPVEIELEQDEEEEEQEETEDELQNGVHIEQVVVEEQGNEELSEKGSSMEDFSEVYQELIFEEVIDNET